MSLFNTVIETSKYYASLLNVNIARGYLSLPHSSPAADHSLRQAILWLCRAQDATNDGGVARSYSLAYSQFVRRRGWFPSYPETTGYIIPTMFDYARKTDNTELFHRAVRMADWESDVQMSSGAVQGGTIGDTPTPAVFNTGQVIFGWLRAFQETQNERYLASAIRAGDFLLASQSSDGAWRKNLTEYASGSMPHYTYNTRTAWGLFLLGQVTGSAAYCDAAVRNIEFALTEQRSNGWFGNNCLYDPTQPLVHTIAYSVRGILEVGIETRNERFIAAARRAADAVLGQLRSDGSLAARYDEQWQPTVNYSCLTGNAQMGIIWGRLFQISQREEYLSALSRVNRYMRSVQWQGTGNPGLDGGISGSFPIHGHYGKLEVLNWAVKFFADALMLEDQIVSQQTALSSR